MSQQQRFHQFADKLQSKLKGSEFFTSYLAGEATDFCRLNGNKIRQAGHVEQSAVDLCLIDQGRQVKGRVMLSGDLSLDEPVLDRWLGTARSAIAVAPEDPYLLYATDVKHTEMIRNESLPVAKDAIEEIIHQANGLDLVGIWASGPIYRGFANSLGQRNWYESNSFNFNWSCYYQADKAVKQGYAGFAWDKNELQAKLNQCRQELDVIKRPSKAIAPGGYRVYLAPSAVAEIMDILSWGCFGLKSQQTKQSPLLKLVDGRESLHQNVSITEDIESGIAPNFDHRGFVRPDTTPLISKGKHHGSLVSARSAKEFSAVPVGANDQEAPEALSMHHGDLEREQITEQLGNGIYVNNLWYLNYSDRTSCRITGMTRFASFWVENGEIVAPLDVMRFDETLYNMFGKNLTSLTKERDFILSSSTYEQRAATSHLLPGALIEDFRFTL